MKEHGLNLCFATSMGPIGKKLIALQLLKKIKRYEFWLVLALFQRFSAIIRTV
jgi:hypothetical protein